MQVEDDVRPPSAHEPVDRCRLPTEQQLMVLVQINPVGVAGGPDRATIRICLGDNGQLDGWKAVGDLLGRPSKQGLEGPSS